MSDDSANATSRARAAQVPAAGGPLAGLKVLDCTHVIAGAWCSMLLADLGADVVKIEPPSGEVTRGRLGDFRAYDFINRNKRAIAVDFGNPQGVATLHRLAAGADVWVENYRPGTLDRAGLGFEALSAIHPGLIYCSISGFGHDGPYRERGGFDLVAQAMSGVMSFVGQPGAEPSSTGVPIADLNAGTFAALGVLAALAHRHKSGEGQHVETTLLESALAYTVWETGLYLTLGEVSRPAGSRHRLAAPYEALRTADGSVVVGVNNQKLWQRFCTAIGAEELREDPRFENNFVRIVHREELRSEIERRLASASSEHWISRFVENDVPCGPILRIDEALEDPQVAARGVVVRVGDRQFLGSPIHLSRTPTSVSRGPAEVGEHTRQVLLESGFAGAEVEALLESGAVAEGRKP
ncbi:MAG TPA: CaiB/BaiF CoA-transferase family protein [Candidatus Binatia bacterium]|jgi:crotonobetainyl-CoA:carnitine CoA-transferase CaiB-like acyl-CoA transferase